MKTKTASSNHSLIYALLVVLAISIVGVSKLHLALVPHNLAIFAIATVMAVLVAIQYMGLKVEGALVYWLMVIPFVIFAIFVFTLIPEFVWNHTLFSSHPAPGGH